MKYIYCIFLILLTATTVKAQLGYNHLNIDAGINIEGDKSYNLGYEINKGTYNAWEIAVEVHLSDTFNRDSLSIGENVFQDILVPKREEMFLAGVYYKPLIVKKRNMIYNFRTGLLLGTSEGFVIGVGAGFEATYNFSNLLAVFIKQSNHYIININQRFRHSIHAGIKIPF